MAEASLSGLTITGGVQPSGAGVYAIGAKSLTVTHCDIRGNAGSFAGVYFQPYPAANLLATHTLTIVESRIRDNVGRGITVTAFADDDQTISVEFSILNSSVSGNRDQMNNNGGGIIFEPGSNRENSTTTLKASIVNTTISGNGDGYYPGVLVDSYLNGPGSTCTTTLNIINSTITGNTTRLCCLAVGLNANTGAGAGSTNQTSVNLSNTIIAGNVTSGGTSKDIGISGNTTLTGFHNLIGDAATAGGLQDGVNSVLFPLENEHQP